MAVKYDKKKNTETKEDYLVISVNYVYSNKTCK